MARPKNEEKTSIIPNDSSSELVTKQAELVRLHENANKILKQEYNFDEQLALAKGDWKAACALAEEAVYRTLSLGKRLLVMKEIEGHGKFTHVCKYVGIDDSRASEAMRLYREYGDNPLPKIAEAGPRKMLELLRMPEEIRADVMQTGLLDGEELASTPIRKLYDMIKQYKTENAELREKNTKGKQELMELRGTVDDLKAGRRTPEDSDLIDVIADIEKNSLGAIDVVLASFNYESMSNDGLITVRTFINKARMILAKTEAHILDLNPSYNILMEAEQTDDGWESDAMDKAIEASGIRVGE
jgi:hypothetical protein